MKLSIIALDEKVFRKMKRTARLIEIMKASLAKIN